MAESSLVSTFPDEEMEEQYRTWMLRFEQGTAHEYLLSMLTAYKDSLPPLLKRIYYCIGSYPRDRGFDVAEVVDVCRNVYNTLERHTCEQGFEDLVPRRVVEGYKQFISASLLDEVLFTSEVCDLLERFMICIDPGLSEDQKGIFAENAVCTEQILCDFKDMSPSDRENLCGWKIGEPADCVAEEEEP